MVKEPYELTLKEFAEKWREYYPEYTETGMRIWSKYRAGMSIINIHKSEVERALKEGKKVPEEVLKTYPELMRKYAGYKPVEKKPTEEEILIASVKKQLELKPEELNIKFVDDITTFLNITPEQYHKGTADMVGVVADLISKMYENAEKLNELYKRTMKPEYKYLYDALMRKIEEIKGYVNSKQISAVNKLRDELRKYIDEKYEIRVRTGVPELIDRIIEDLFKAITERPYVTSNWKIKIGVILDKIAKEYLQKYQIRALKPKPAGMEKIIDEIYLVEKGDTHSIIQYCGKNYKVPNWMLEDKQYLLFYMRAKYGVC